MIIRWVSILLVLAALGWGGWTYWQRQLAPKGDEYLSVTVDRGDIVKTVSANGTLNPVVLVNVGTQVSGTIKKLHADFNDRVKSGQVLAELDPALFKAAVDQSRANRANAEASLKLAEANAGRTRALYEKGYVARAEWDQAIQAVEAGRAQVAAAAATVRRDETNLRFSVIVSSVSGIVVSRNVDVGQTVAASFQTPVLFTIAENLKRMQIDTTVAEADVGGIKVGQVATFTVDAFPGREYQGRVRQIRLNSQVLQNVVTYNVVIDVANPDESLLPGMTAFVNIAIARRENVLRLPLSVLRYKPTEPETGKTRGSVVPRTARTNEKTVYRLREGQPDRITFQPGLSDNKYMEILSGDIKPGDVLITEDNKPRKDDQKSGGGGAGSSFKVRMF
ncbi:MAG: efflux RND transporter periplasmic adaptor subunit [Methylococcaceae bacterium]|nr:efflux RND transporter periplasmic adaptor subunit [Methylococcaceae bacterium]